MNDDRCDRTVAINFPCAMAHGHDGVCQPDPEGQLRLYGITVENLREIQRDLADARRYGLVRGDGAPTVHGRYVRLVAGLERLLPRAGSAEHVRARDVRAVLDEATGYEERRLSM